jgi:hypothetical protein
LAPAERLIFGADGVQVRVKLGRVTPSDMAAFGELHHHSPDDEPAAEVFWTAAGLGHGAYFYLDEEPSAIGKLKRSIP